MTNPTEKGSASHSPLDTSHSLRSDELWIRDVEATNLQFDITLEQLDACFGSEPFFCEYCGAKFTLWPVQLFAEHCVAMHAEILTLQQHQAFLLLCTAGLTIPAKQFLWIQLMTRSTVRRRARDLGLITFCDAQGNPLPKEPRKIVM